MTRRNRYFFIFGVAILAVLIGVSLFYVSADKTKMNLALFSADLSFAGVIGTMAALALALIAIGYSIREADIRISLGHKHVTPTGVLWEIKVCNRGNALGNVAHAFVEIEVPQTSLISFAGAQGMNFQPTQNQTRKQYRFDQPQNTMDLYPARYIWRLLGFIEVPVGITGDITLSVQIVGTQGHTRKKFRMNL
ncbi:MAG: hypothetical protein HY670_08210 [Chloroflexi bacterium]|nr:hypothetical protein [Chloroflexota bacterium]